MAKLDPSKLTLHPVVRASILVAFLGGLVLITWCRTGKLLPTDPEQVLLVQSSLLMIVLATLLSERYFTGPDDALLNGLSALLTVLPLWSTAPRAPWWALVGFLLFLIVSALTTLLLQGGQRDRSTNATLVRLQSVGFQVSTALGRARVVFSVVFLAAVVFFVKRSDPLATSLLVFWGIYLALWPIGLPQLLSNLLRRKSSDRQRLGTLVRIDSPNLARVMLAAESRWTGDEDPVIISFADGSHKWGIPLMSENRADGVLGTVLIDATASAASGEAGDVRSADGVTGRLSRTDFVNSVSKGKGKTILGLVREASNSKRLRFELLPSANVELGQLVVVHTPGGWVYYQLVDGETAEEVFGSLNYGSQVAVATPVGLLEDGEFRRASWLPSINAPVFGVDSALTGVVEQGGFVLGHISGTHLELRGNFVDRLESHTAILGATGSGKTELAFDLIRHAIDARIKVICIDLTSQYASRLSDLAPTHLTISDEKAQSLSDKLFDAETGAYGGGAEKKILKEFAADLRVEVDQALREFLTGGQSSLALVELREIANTKATLWITEMFLSTLLRLMKEGVSTAKVLVVIEEAHTVMPEASFAGLGDFDSKGTVAKISQLALQGRKYGVGLLVLAQRTATVSKSVLTQCNTVISFACIDDTSIKFLGNVYGSSVAEGLPGLRKLRGVAHGDWIGSDLPLMFDIPFDPEKAARVGWAAQRGSGDQGAN